MIANMMIAVAAAVAAMGTGSPTESRHDSLVVHEWGTFTTFAGSDGRAMPFYSGVGAAGDGSLPEWVFGYSAPDGRLAAVEAARLKFSEEGLVRMETPVIYFYSARPTTVDVRVEFKHGIMTEFYPPPTRVGMPAREREEFLRAASSLVWEGVSVRPEAEGARAALPDAGRSHYGAARATDGDLVTVKAEGKTYTEKFLFYRGVADFELPVTVRASGKDAFEISNAPGAAPVRAILMEVNGGALRYTSLDVPAGMSRATLPKEPADAEALARSLVKLLAEAGLYPKEANAMVNTWRAHWLGEPGVRVLYVVPRGEVDRALPLEIKPTPEKVERVFVGRAEVMTPEVEGKVKDLLARMEAAPEEKRDGIMEQVRALTGRFTGTACEHVRAMGKRQTAGVGR